MSTAELQRLVSIVATLRGPTGCRWDKAQNFRTLRPYLLEELYEVLEAIDNDSPDALHEELGDLLFIVFLLCQIATENRYFTLESMCKGIADKMVLRHPHVFGEEGQPLSQIESPMRTWENEKAKNRPQRSRLAGVPKSLPSLLRAHRQGEKAAAIGFDWPDHHGVLAKVDEEMSELLEAISTGSRKAIAHELGDVLMALSSLGRHLNTPSEESLREANDRFFQRFSTMERLARSQQIDVSHLSAEELDSLWQQAKNLEE